jgi:hypothetical protein
MQSQWLAVLLERTEREGSGQWLQPVQLRNQIQSVNWTEQSSRSMNGDDAEVYGIHTDEV